MSTAQGPSMSKDDMTIQSPLSYGIYIGRIEFELYRVLVFCQAFLKTGQLALHSGLHHYVPDEGALPLASVVF